MIEVIPSTPQRPHDGRARGRMAPRCQHAALPNLSNTRKHCNPKEPHLPVITFVYIFLFYVFGCLPASICMHHVSAGPVEARRGRCTEDRDAVSPTWVLRTSPGYSARATRLLLLIHLSRPLQFELFKVIL